jgi:hypothetical protein
MPPRPIDSRNVYQKTLHVQHEVEKLQDGVEKDKHIRQQFMTEERERKSRDQVELLEKRAPARKTEKEAQREKRQKQKEEKKQSEADEEQEIEDLQNDLRRRLPEDDLGKGDMMDVKG